MFLIFSDVFIYLFSSMIPFTVCACACARRRMFLMNSELKVVFPHVVFLET